MAERPGTITAQPARIAPADHPYAVQFQTTHSDANLTATPQPDADTKQFTLDAEYLPEAPPGYDLLRNLGSGGMGTVYLAYEHATERNVAIKFLHSPTSGTAFDRFLIEVRALAELKHENIINVLDVKTTWREPYFTMDFANGGTLSNLTKPDRLPTPFEAARLMQCAANAIAAAHAKDIIHRDIKPSNILLFENASDSAETPLAYTPRVSDFGLAKRLDRGADLTKTGPLGTPCYMSPEAAAGRSKELTATTDIYGLGATLFHLLAGRPPFTGESNDEILKKVLNDEPPRLRSLRPEVPPGLEAIVMKALEKNPAARYASANAFSADLGRFLAGAEQEAPLLSPRRRAQRWLGRNRKPAAVWTGVVLIVATIFIVGLAMAPAPKANPSPDPIAAHLAKVKANLAAGKPVTLLGETGLPLLYQWRLMPSTLVESPGNDKSAAFATTGTTLLELSPDELPDSYRFSADIQHIVGEPAIPGSSLSNSSVGIYFGYAGDSSGDWKMNTLYAARYTDFAPVADMNRNLGRPAVQFGDGLYPQHPSRLPTTSWNGTGGLSFTPRPERQWPGMWRKFAVEVSRQKIVVRWRATPTSELETVYELTGERATARYAELGTQMKVYDAESQIVPLWRPTMPFGIIAYRSTVAIKNVVLEPLP